MSNPDLSAEIITQALPEHRVNLYPRSRVTVPGAALALARIDGERALCVAARDTAELPDGFDGPLVQSAAAAVKVCPLNHANAACLRQTIPWTAPVSLRDVRTTLGCGDRLGRATPGHLRAIAPFDAAPVLAQQSIRELTLTGRTFENVVDDVTFHVLQEGYTGGYGADGDHLKTLADINTAVDAGMAMITLDLTERMNAEAETWPETRVEDGFGRLPDGVRRRLLATYADRTFELAGASVHVPGLEAKRCAVMYLAAMDFAGEVHELLRERRGHAFDLEISIDETQAPTLPAHHLFIIRELLYRDVEVTSLAPRFIGEFQKAIDYIGDLAEFERQFEIHCAIARACGEYRISIHSGSDKFSVYPIIGKHTGLRVHVKTAGTSWLEALRTIASCDPTLYRRIHRGAYDALEEALKLYHITPDFDAIPEPETLADEDLPRLLNHDDARQLLHVTYGGLLSHADLGPAFFAALDEHEEAYWAGLEKHFRKHLQTLGLTPTAD